MKKTLGGDRLGSGSKMQVELHNYERSTHDLGYLWRSTMSAGTLVPFLSKIALPGDTFDIHLDCDIKTHPTIGPLFGSYKVQLDVFLTPIRLYNSLLHNNTLGIGNDMSKVKFPQIQMTALPIDVETVADLDNCQINPSSVLAYFGLRGIGFPDGTSKLREFNITSYLMYMDIYKNYYANKQEDIGAVIHTPAEAIIDTVDNIFKNENVKEVQESPIIDLVTFNQNDEFWVFYTGTAPDPQQLMFNTIQHGVVSLWDLCAGAFSITGTEIIGILDWNTYGDIQVANWRYKEATDVNQTIPNVSTFPLANIDEMRMNILAYNNSSYFPYIINTANLEPYKWLYEQPDGVPNILSTQEGLAIKTYQSDLLNNWLQTEWFDGTNGINAITAIDVSGGSFTIDQLTLSRKVYDMLNRIAVSGGSYNDWLDAVYAHERYTLPESPVYMGGLIRELVFQEVVSNSDSGDQPLGTLAGKGIMASKRKGGKVVIKVDEPSYIIGIISLTPRLDYSQGNKWDMHLRSLDDLHKPAMDQIGFQELITEQMAWWDTQWSGGEWVQQSAGKQPAWINYMTSLNETRGNFAIASNEMFMTLNRRYERSGVTDRIQDLTTYIDPVKFNNIFANTSIDAQNFWAQIAVDITARRKMSAKVMPNL